MEMCTWVVWTYSLLGAAGAATLSATCSAVASAFLENSCDEVLKVYVAATEKMARPPRTDVALRAADIVVDVMGSVV